MKRLRYLTLASLILAGSLAASEGNSNAGNNAAAENIGINVASAYSSATHGASTEPAGKVELTFWTLGSGNYEELANEYTKEHPNVTIQIQNTNDQTAYQNNLTTTLSAGSGTPDIAQVETDFIESFSDAQDKFYNLNDFGAKDIKANYLDWIWKQASSAGGSFQLGLPADISPTVVYYRADLAEVSGLPSDPEGFSAAISTWDKFASVAKAYNAITSKYFSDLTDLTYNALLHQSSEEIYYSKADGEFIGDTNPQVKKAYDFTVKGIQEGWVSNYPLSSPEWSQAIDDCSFAVIIGPAWLAGNLKSGAPDSSGKWKIALLPEGAGNGGGSFITLPKEGKHPKEAYDFISWMVNKENQLKLFTSQGLIPSIPALYEDPAFLEFRDEFFGGQQTAAEFGKAAKRVKPAIYGPLHDQADSFFKNALKNVMEKQADPVKEWDEAVNQAKTLSEHS